MVRKTSVLIALTVLCSLAHAQEKFQAVGDSAIIYGKNYSFTLAAPKGWLLDTTSGRGQGLQAVFYPKGSSWQNGPVVMYANVYQKKNVTKELLRTVIANDVAEYEKKSSEVKVIDVDPLPTRRDERTKDKKATIKYFMDHQNGNDEAVAYIDEPRVVVMLVLTAKNKKDFQLSLPAFKELVSSYFFLGEAVIQQ